MRSTTQTLWTLILTLLLAAGSLSAARAAVLINELDADTAGTDVLEFVELYNTGPSAVDLDAGNYVLVFFNGDSNDESYEAIDLTGTIAAGGYYVVGNTAVANVNQIIPSNGLQNGEDGVGLYSGVDATTDFPDGTVATATNIVDAIVYDTDDDADPALVAALGVDIQINENENGNKDNESIYRTTDGAGSAQTWTGNYTVGTPTPGTENGVGVGPVSVANLAEAKALGIGVTFELTGSVTVLSGTEDLTGFRGQLWVQDSSGADGQTGILIDDSSGNMGGSFTEGQVLSGIQGSLSTYNEVLQLVPNSDTSVAASAGSVPAPLVVTSAITDFETIEGELVELQGITISETGTWAANTNYELVSPTGTVFNAIRIEDNCGLVGQTIPSGAFNLVGVAHQFNTDYQIMPRFVSDLSLGDDPNISVPATLAFGAVQPGNSKTLDITVTNSGSSTNLNVTGSSLAGDSEFTVVGSLPTGITPGNSDTITIQFSPTTTGDYAGSITLTSNDESGDQPVVTFTGLAAQPGSGEVLINEFDTDTFDLEYIELYNTTASPIDLAAGGYVLVFVNGNGNLVYQDTELTGTIPANGYYVVTEDTVTSISGYMSDQVASWSSFQNGTDGIALVKGASGSDFAVDDDPGDAIAAAGATIVDAVIYGDGQIGGYAEMDADLVVGGALLDNGSGGSTARLTDGQGGAAPLYAESDWGIRPRTAGAANDSIDTGLPFYDEFNYAAGSLNDTEDWVQKFSTTDNPIQVAAGSLSYPGLVRDDSSPGKLVLQNDGNSDFASSERLFDAVTGGDLYASFLINGVSGPTDLGGSADLLWFDEDAGNSFARGKIFIMPSASGTTKYRLGISIYDYENAVESSNLDVGTTYFVVLKYSQDGAGSEDQVSLYIDPLPGGSEPGAPTISYKASEGADPENQWEGDPVEGLVLQQHQYAGAWEIQMDAIRVGTTWQQVNPGDASIEADPTALSFGSVQQGDTSDPLRFAVSGSGLSGDVTATAPAGFEVSTGFATGYGATATLSPAGSGVLAETMLYVRFAPTGTTAFTGDLTLSSAGASDVTVALSGQGIAGATPRIDVSTIGPLDFGSSTGVGQVSDPTTYTVVGENLVAPITITAPADFELSLDDSSYGPSVSVGATSPTTTVYVRFAPDTLAPAAGEIGHESTLATYRWVDVTAEVGFTDAEHWQLFE